METIELNTTQNVSLEFPVASIADRILSHLIDTFILVLYVVAIGIGVLQWFSASAEWWMIFLLIPIVFYHLLFEVFFNGQSPGKQIMKIKVFKADGSQLSTGSCFIRWLFRLADVTMTSGALATIVIIFNGKGQRLGDIAADTTVLKTGKKHNFDQTVWMEVDENYQPRFPEAERLSDKDVLVIKEVLQATSNPGNQTDSSIHLLINTRKAIEQKTNTESNLSDKEYLKTIMKDYNACHRETI
jgi:uncharacterized RDD family membrane protein YckC